MEPTFEHVSELRSKFLQKLETEHGSKQTNYFHPCDMDRVLKSDDWLRRFLVHHENDIKSALNMVWETCLWRSDNQVNDINENNVNTDYLEEGSMFVHNRDKDGKLLFIFKCKMHLKGQKDLEQLKRCVVYWFERVDKMEKNAMISIFFDMQDTGLSNMDMDYTKYLIGLCKLYYPNFLNYILIFEMPWILNAAFKVIKAWLPPKGVQKIKFVNKSNLKEFVDHDQALACWGGGDDYVFKFSMFPSQLANDKSDDTKKKVHFADGSPLAEGAPCGFENIKEDNFQNTVLLSITPSESVLFSEGHHSELNGVVKLTNVSGNPITYKIKTTSPEKFRVRPSLGLLQPSFSASINVSVQPGFTAHSIFRDKFLVMSFPCESHSLSQSELSELWKAADVKKISQHRLKCFVVHPHSHVQNGAAFNLPLRAHSYETDGDQKISQLISAVNHMTQCNEKIITQMSYINILEKIIITLLVLLAIAVYMVYTNLPPVNAVYSPLHDCSSRPAEHHEPLSFREECYKPD